MVVSDPLTPGQVSFLLGVFPVFIAWAYSEILEYKKSSSPLKVSNMPNGQPKWLLSFIPSYPLLNFLLTTAVYLFISYRVFYLTNTLKVAFVPSKNDKRLLQNVIAGAAISVCLYFTSLILLHIPQLVIATTQMFSTRFCNEKFRFHLISRVRMLLV